MARGRSDNFLSLDSLLDTVTNVVGFLVIVLAVVTLNVGQIGKKPPPTLPPPPPPDTKPAVDPELARKIFELRERLMALLARIDKTRGDIDNSPAKPFADEKESLEKLLQDLLAKKGDIEKAIREAQERLKGLEGKLAKPPPPPPPPPEETLPGVSIIQTWRGDDANKPAWANKKRLVYACRYGRIFRINRDGLRTTLENGIRDCLGIRSGKKSIDRDGARQLERYFGSRVIGDQQVRIKLKFIDMVISGELIGTYELRSKTLGHATAEVQANPDLVEKQLAGVRPQDAWVMFWVWSDSFDTFLAASPLMKKAKLDVGWIPFDKDEECEFRLFGGGGGVHIGHQ